MIDDIAILFILKILNYGTKIMKKTIRWTFIPSKNAQSVPKRPVLTRTRTIIESVISKL